MARKIREKENIELVSLDWMFGYSLGNSTNKIHNMLKEFEKLYPETKDQKIFQYFNKRKKD